MENNKQMIKQCWFFIFILFYFMVKMKMQCEPINGGSCFLGPNKMPKWAKY
jgi:hypothetical protein